MEDNQTHQLNFTESNFTYSISYDIKSEGIQIEAVHNKEFLSWSNILSSDLEDATSNGIKYTFTTSILFKIFEMYVKKALPELTSIKLPSGYKASDVPLAIEIATGSPYDSSDKDIKFISLDPVRVTSDKRFELKLDQRDKKIKELETKINKLADEIYILCDKFDKLEFVKPDLAPMRSETDDNDSLR